VGAVPILVDCDPVTLNIDLDDAAEKIAQAGTGRLPARLAGPIEVAGIMPVHVGGLMLPLDALREFARKHNLWIVEDAAHAFPSRWRPSTNAPWITCGENTADVTCFSFYANKTLTTGEGGMAVTAHPELAERMRLMALHGLSRDAWTRFDKGGSWDYDIVAPGFKYNLTDIAAAIGVHQLRRAEQMRASRAAIAAAYIAAFSELDEIETPVEFPDTVHSWHLFPIRINTDRLSIDRNDFICELEQRGVGCSVHWRPLHLHRYYLETYAWDSASLPASTREWRRLVSLPIYPTMTASEVRHVVDAVSSVCARFARPGRR
jgi:perosamine synthetase